MTCKEKIDNIEKILDDEYECKIERIREVVESEETTVEPKLEKDGTLVVTTEHYENVGRVLVQYGTSGTLFYQDQEPCEDAKYEEDINKLKEQILKEGSNLISKRDLFKRFDKVNKEYKGRPWNFLQILANINILIGQEPCEDCCNGNQIEKAKLCQKSYLAGMEHKQEPCEDCVSRKELLKTYEDKFIELQKLKLMEENKNLKDEQLGVNWCINVLRELPSVTPTEWEQDHKLLKACGDAVDIVLDKITADIEQLENSITMCYGGGFCTDAYLNGLAKCKEIIDKYKE